MARRPGETRLDRAHKLVSTFLVPPCLALLGWIALQFIEVRDGMRDVRKTVELEIPHLKQVDQYADTRLTRLEGWIFGRDR